ncbi:MAG: helix-turn-helix domain-containing protein [Clostridiales bacterium]|nr:helix-turn-helix domain-containing protein [Clostridiales bacterium]
MDVIEKIDRLRKERGWSVNGLAMESMLTQSTVNNLFSRKNEPKLSTLRAICDAFHITLAEFFQENDPDNEYENEILRRVRALSDEQKEAVLTILRSIG